MNSRYTCLMSRGAMALCVVFIVLCGVCVRGRGPTEPPSLTHSRKEFLFLVSYKNISLPITPPLAPSLLKIRIPVLHISLERKFPPFPATGWLANRRGKKLKALRQPHLITYPTTSPSYLNLHHSWTGQSLLSSSLPTIPLSFSSISPATSQYLNLCWLVKATLHIWFSFHFIPFFFFFIKRSLTAFWVEQIC
ncbi:hypothetical protein DFP73DRAFT_28489 [Morchella snyderi]|nr:hypothetical protein DFP73DRAFT_28489 [Morchella snyderi]